MKYKIRTCLTEEDCKLLNEYWQYFLEDKPEMTAYLSSTRVKLREALLDAIEYRRG